MFEEYKKQVLLDYQQKRDASELDLSLLSPSPARLRDHCLEVCFKRPRKEDETALRKFFGYQAKWDWTELMNTIRDFDVDKFKPLVRYLRGKTGDTEDKNVELLAWLIDYPDRPYRFDPGLLVGTAPAAVTADYPNTFTPEPMESPVMEAVAEQTESPAQREPLVISRGFSEVNPARKWPVAGTWIVLLLALLSGGAISWLFQQRGPGAGDGGQRGCMVWSVDHYRVADCSQKLLPPPVPLDTGLLKGFRQVLVTDSLPESVVGRLWYFKVKDHLELFTAEGFHPVYTDRRLKPLTLYIYRKYVGRDTLKTP